MVFVLLFYKNLIKQCCVLCQGRINPPVVVSLIMELIRRQGLQIALSGRDEDSLLPVLSFLNK
jgi:U3 small nucleolar RNA-associated protein 15